MKVYLCGGINGLSDSDCNDWRDYAREHLVHETVDPMRRDYRGREAENYKEIVTLDLQDINECEVVLVNATRPSWGTAMEVFYAFRENKRVVLWVGPGGLAKVSPWLRYHCGEMHEVLSDCIHYINGWK